MTLLPATTARAEPPPPRARPRLLRLGWLGLLGVACGTAPPVRPPVPPVPPAAASPSASASPSATLTAACREAAALTARASAERSGGCARAWAEQAAAKCPEHADAASALARAKLSALLSDRGAVTSSSDGQFLVENRRDGALLWKLEPSRPVLVHVVEGDANYPRFDGHRLFVLRGSRLDVIDPDGGTVHTELDVQAWAREGDTLLLVGQRSIRRHDAKTWAVTGTVRAERDIEAKPNEIETLLSGRIVHAGNAIGSFASGKVIASGNVRTLSAASKRALLCSAEDELVAVDLVQERELGRFSGAGVPCSYAFPALMGAGKYAVWFEARDEGGTVARSMDLGSGKITDTIDRQTSIGGLWAGVAVDPRDDTRLCLTNAGKTWASTTCSWKLVGSRVVRSAALPRPTPTGKAVEWGKRLGVRDDELASALGPDGRIVVLATCEPSPRPDDVAGSHLRLRSFDVQSHRPLDSVLLREAAFPFAWLTMGMGMGTPPSLVFVAPRRVLFTAGQPSVLQTAVYDLDAKTLVPIAGTEVALTDSPSVLALGSGKIFDTRAMKALELTADEAAFRAAHTLPPVCDGK